MGNTADADVDVITILGQLGTDELPEGIDADGEAESDGGDDRVEQGDTCGHDA